MADPAPHVSDETADRRPGAEAGEGLIMKQQQREAYADAVIAALTFTTRFPDLSDPTVADVVRQAIMRHAATPYAAFEVIIDDPISANWRLKAHATPGQVRLACYRMKPGVDERAMESRVNRDLDRLATKKGEHRG